MKSDQRQFSSKHVRVEVLCGEDLLYQGEADSQDCCALGRGLHSNLEYIKFLNQDQQPLPKWYHIKKNDALLGNAVFRTGPYYLPFTFGRQNIATIKMKAAILQNPFLDCNQEVIDNLPIKDILKIHHTDVVVMHCIPYAYLPNLKKISLLPGVIRYLGRPPYTHSYITFEESFNNYCSQFKSKGYKLKRKVRRFKKNCRSTMRVKAYEQVDDVDEFLACANRISCKTYQHRLLKVGFQKNRNESNRARFLAKYSMLKSFILFDGDIPVAYLYASNVNGRLFAHKTGYDPLYAKLSPGTVLWFEVIKILFQDKQVKFFDLSEGEARFKTYFGSKHLRCINIYYFRKTFFTLMTILFHIIYNAIHNLFRKVVDVSKLNQKVKRFFEVTIH